MPSLTVHLLPPSVLWFSAGPKNLINHFSGIRMNLFVCWKRISSISPTVQDRFDCHPGKEQTNSADDRGNAQNRSQHFIHPLPACRTTCGLLRVNGDFSNSSQRKEVRKMFCPFINGESRKVEPSGSLQDPVQEAGEDIPLCVALLLKQVRCNSTF